MRNLENYARLAVYFTPGDGSPLADFGQRILGRNSHTARSESAGSSFKDHERWFELTRQAAHYGFHATLKAPFELAANQSVDALAAACSSLARATVPIELSGLAPREFDDFVALTLVAMPHSLRQLARNCVIELDRYRAPISEYDRLRKLDSQLSTRQVQQLESYGYPYIFHDFTFHMTLSSRLSEHDHDFIQWVRGEYRQCVSKTPLLDRLALFAQTTRDNAFIKIDEYALTGEN